MDILDVEDVLFSISEFLDFDSKIKYFFFISFTKPKSRITNRMVSIIAKEYKEIYSEIKHFFLYDDINEIYMESIVNEYLLEWLISINKFYVHSCNKANKNCYFCQIIQLVDYPNSRRRLIILYQVILNSTSLATQKNIQRKSRSADDLYYGTKYLMKQIDYSFLLD